MATKKQSAKQNGEDISKSFPTRLYRSEKNKIIGGVAAGIGDYVGIDPTIIRALFALLAIFGGSGLVLYLILWVVVPTESSSGISGEHIKENIAEMKTKAKSITASFQEKDKNNRSTWAILLIIFGAFFLFSNLGYFNIDMGKLWPIWLIIGGILLLRRR